jgi:hypothetical protein
VRWEEKNEKRVEVACLMVWMSWFSTSSRLVKSAGRGSERWAQQILLCIVTKMWVDVASQSLQFRVLSEPNPWEKNLVMRPKV